MNKNKLISRNAGFFFAMMLAVCVPALLWCENIRGEITGTAEINGGEIVFNPENIIIINPGTTPAFQEGIEIRLRIPASLNQYQNSFALLIFRDVTPSPTAENRSYRGTRTYMRLLPSRTSAFFRIPFQENHGISGDALTDVIPVPVGLDQFPLLLTILPVMKGIPDSAFMEELGISVVPLWKNEGSLTVNVANPSGNPEEIVDITVDGSAVDSGKELILPAGIHRVQISSTHAPAVEKTIVLEPGQIMSLDLPLDYRPPVITVSIPEGAIILLDGETITTRDSLIMLETTSGDHVITYNLGNLKVDRHFTIKPGGTMKIDMIMDIQIVEVGD